jgi:purine-binding chemotaxis protein CheW
MGAAETAAESGQFLTFALGEEAYGVEILRVQEIRGYTAVTPIPGAPPFVKGVMNLRGAVIPVVDLRRRLGMDEAPCTPLTVVVVVTVGPRVMGLVVDAVSDVLEVTPGAIEATPDLGGEVDTRLVSGLAKTPERLVMLLDLERLLGAVDRPA